MSSIEDARRISWPVALSTVQGKSIAIYVAVLRRQNDIDDTYSYGMSAY